MITLESNPTCTQLKLQVGYKKGINKKSMITLESNPT